MSKKILVVYGHHNVKESFNASIRDTFIKEAKTCGHEIDLINLHEEKQLDFYDGSPPNEQVLNYRERLEKSYYLYKKDRCCIYIFKQEVVMLLLIEYLHYIVRPWYV